MFFTRRLLTPVDERMPDDVDCRASLVPETGADAELVLAEAGAPPTANEERTGFGHHHSAV